MSKKSIKNKNVSIIIALSLFSVLFFVFGFLQLDKTKEDKVFYDDKVETVFSDCLSLISRNISGSKSLRLREDRAFKVIEVFDNEKDPSNIFVSLLGTVSSFNSCRGFSLKDSCIGESCLSDKKAMVYFKIEARKNSF